MDLVCGPTHFSSSVVPNMLVTDSPLRYFQNQISLGLQLVGLSTSGILVLVFLFMFGILFLRLVFIASSATNTAHLMGIVLTGHVWVTVWMLFVRTRAMQWSVPRSPVCYTGPRVLRQSIDSPQTVHRQSIDSPRTVHGVLRESSDSPWTVLRESSDSPWILSGVLRESSESL